MIVQLQVYTHRMDLAGCVWSTHSIFTPSPVPNAAQALRMSGATQQHYVLSFDLRWAARSEILSQRHVLFQRHVLSVHNLLQYLSSLIF